MYALSLIRFCVAFSCERGSTFTYNHPIGSVSFVTRNEVGGTACSTYIRDFQFLSCTLYRSHELITFVLSNESVFKTNPSS